jgi:hypothetical protein
MEDFNIYHNSNIFYSEVTLITTTFYNNDLPTIALNEIIMVLFDRQYKFSTKLYRKYSYSEQTVQFLTSNCQNLIEYFNNVLIQFAIEILNNEIIFDKHIKDGQFNNYIQSNIIITKGEKIDLLNYKFNRDKETLLNWIDDKTKNIELKKFIENIYNVSQVRLN